MSILTILGVIVYFAITLTVFGVIVWYLGFIWETILNNRQDRVLYHGSNVREQGALVERLIKKYVPVSEIASYTLVEPGAGMAIVSHYLATRFTWKSIRAIEIGGYILLAGRLRYLFHPARGKVVWKKQNLFTADYPVPAVVYCYLFTQLITKLYESGKLEGCLVISLTFPINGVMPTEEIPLESWQKRIYVYDFRTAGLTNKSKEGSDLSNG